MADAKAISLRDVRFAWPQSPPLLDIAGFSLGRGERLFLRGPSGSGKSTLLGLIAGVLEVQSGRIEVLGEDLTALSGGQRDRLRAGRMGVIFQMFNLVPYLSVVQNVMLPCRFSPARRASTGGHPAGEARRLLARLGLSDENLLARPVTELSVGQQQRVAVARALIGGPELLIADEPTSALDPELVGEVLKVMCGSSPSLHPPIAKTLPPTFQTCAPPHCTTWVVAAREAQKAL